jgi:hypothetical protein
LPWPRPPKLLTSDQMGLSGVQNACGGCPLKPDGLGWPLYLPDMVIVWNNTSAVAADSLYVTVCCSAAAAFV